MKNEIVHYLIKEMYEPENRSQKAIIKSLKSSQMTIIKYISELKGEDVVKEEKLGTNVMYSVRSLDFAYAKGYLKKIVEEKYKMFTVRIFEFNSNYIIDFNSPFFNFSIPTERDELLKMIKQLQGEFEEIWKKLRHIRKKISKEISKKSKGGDNLAKKIN